MSNAWLDLLPNAVRGAAFCMTSPWFMTFNLVVQCNIIEQQCTVDRSKNIPPC